ncbi:RING-H2 finger protein [Quillaja saponaria]|uniref:RING-type E3 ubiquitin transferase n=1 Tax=Quillaja saponaria TaxID=32244 RepID=A0AAD7PIT3_QUISA|nr:RING-H2 finger protein [Quillaja saponaria]
MTRITYEKKQKDGILVYQSHQSSLSSSQSPYYGVSNEKEATPSSPLSRVSPLLLLVIVILAAVFFIYGFVHLLLRFLMKRPSSSANWQSNRHPEAISSQTPQRQLQQLFRLQDSGLDQASIDALPVFHYKDVIGGMKEPFDCAVCLCEFSNQDKLRLLPICSHAFHKECIDKWLLSNSTCPLCRGTLSKSASPMENPLFNFDNSWVLSDRFIGEGENECSDNQTPVTIEEDNGVKRVFSVRLGKFRNSGEVEGGEETSSCLDARRCYSMGTFHYVVGDSNLQVVLSHDSGGQSDVRRKYLPDIPEEGDMVGKKINGRTKHESFSVSKIWLRSKKAKFPSSSNTPFAMPHSLEPNL